jgi:hypothetical protein
MSKPPASFKTHLFFDEKKKKQKKRRDKIKLFERYGII